MPKGKILTTSDVLGEPEAEEKKEIVEEKKEKEGEYDTLYGDDITPIPNIIEAKPKKKVKVEPKPVEIDEPPVDVKAIILGKLAEIDSLALLWNANKYKLQRRLIAECRSLVDKL